MAVARASGSASEVGRVTPPTVLAGARSLRHHYDERQLPGFVANWRSRPGAAGHDRQHSGSLSVCPSSREGVGT